MLGFGFSEKMCDCFWQMLVNNTGWGKSMFTVMSTQNIVFTRELLSINYGVIFHKNTCPTLYNSHYYFTIYLWCEILITNKITCTIGWKLGWSLPLFTKSLERLFVHLAIFVKQKIFFEIVSAVGKVI